jgi:hypothetical protein
MVTFAFIWVALAIFVMDAIYAKTGRRAKKWPAAKLSTTPYYSSCA